MIRRLNYHEIDFEKYTQCVENSEQRNFYSQKEILDELSGNWEILVEGDYVAVMPIPLKNKWGFRFVVMPLFCQQLGIFSATDDPNRNDEFINFLQKNYNVVFYSFNHSNQFSKKLQVKKNFVIDSNIYELQRKKYFKGRKSTVKAAQNLTFNEILLDQNSIEFIEENFKGLEKINDFNKLINYIHFLDTNKKLRLFGAYDDERLINLAIVIEDGKEFKLLGLVNDPNAIERNGPSFLIDKILKENLNERKFDFMGGEISRGIEVFFKSFGSRQEVYPLLQHSKKLILKNMFKKNK